MSFEHRDIFAQERFVMGGNVSVIIKDPVGLGRVLESDAMMGLVSREEPEGSRVLGGEVIYYPAEDGRTRSIVATIDYLPHRKCSAKYDLSQVHGLLLDSEVVEPMDITPVPADAADNPGLLISVGENGDSLALYVGSRENGKYATGQVRLELALSHEPDFIRDEQLVTGLLLAWGVAGSALNTPKHRKGQRPVTIVVEGMTYDDTARDLWRVIVDYERLSRQSGEIIPELMVTQSDLEYLTAAYPMDSETLAYAVDHLIEKHLLLCDVDATPKPITMHDIATVIETGSR